MSGWLKGKAAVITGAGRGIGREYALALAREGADVLINDIAGGPGEWAADAVAQEVRELGASAVAHRGDITDPAAVEDMMSTAEQHLGSVDLVVANAGILGAGWIDETSGEQWAKVLSVHVNGTFNCIHSAIPRLRRRGGGSIITTGSLAMNLLFPGLAAYRAAKAAIVVLTHYAAAELQADNINVNSIMPGATLTAMSDEFYASLGPDNPFLNAPARREQQGSGTDAPEPAPADTVPALGVFLCTDAARAITGRAFQLSGTKIGIVDTPSTFAFHSPAGDRWSLAELAERMPDILSEAAPTTAHHG